MQNKAIQIAFLVGVVISLTSKLQTTFFTCEKTDTSNQKSQTVLSVSRQISHLLQTLAAYRAFALRVLRRHLTRNVFLKSFSPKKVTNSEILDQNSFVYSLSIKRIVGSRPAKQQRKGKNRTRRKLNLSCAFYRSYFVFYLSLLKGAVSRNSAKLGNYKICPLN